MDINKVKYRIQVKVPNGNRYTIDETLMDTCNLEENEGEVAARLTFTIKDQKVDNKWLKSYLYVGNYIYVKATDGNGWKEVFRGRIYDRITRAKTRTVEIVAFDLNYRYQRSEVNIYRRKNETGAQLTKRLISRWKNRKVARLDGPTIKLPSKAYDKNQTVTDIIEDCIKESKKKGGGDFVIRCINGEIAVVKTGSNRTVYILSQYDYLEDLENKHSIRNLVTRVRVYRTNEKKQDAREKLVATYDGKTEYGVLQKIIYTNGKTLNEAKKEAKEILKEDGKVQKSRKIIHPDVPFIRKGDSILVNGYGLGTKSNPVNVIVKSINHDIKNLRMEIRA